MIGMMMSSTSEVTMAPNATPMTTPTARSTTLPRRANFLNSSNIKLASFALWSRLRLIRNPAELLREYANVHVHCARSYHADQVVASMRTPSTAERLLLARTFGWNYGSL